MPSFMMIRAVVFMALASATSALAAQDGTGEADGIQPDTLVRPAGMNTKMPATLRYGSGHFDVPVASVLPHRTVTTTLSGFRVSGSGWMSDGSLAVGLFDRGEVGVSLQSLGGGADGGSIVGGFGQWALRRPGERGLGLAVGARYLTSPSFDGSDLDYQPTRLGFPDRGFHRRAGEGGSVSTTFTPYWVATWALPGGDIPFAPPYDISLTAGYGGGMFSSGGDLDFYTGSASGGWFAGGIAHLDLGENLLLNLIGDYNGFDVNLGAQLDFGGLRAGAYVLGTNFEQRESSFRSRKFGLAASVAVCPDGSGSGSLLDRFRCWPSLIRERADADTVRLPAPPPDTVRVEVAPPEPEGREELLCLATGQEVEIMLVEGDTLVGPERASLASFRTTMVFAGAYAEGRPWFSDGSLISFDGANYRIEGPPRSLDCRQIMRVGESMEVPLFTSVDDFSPFVVVYLPVRPGVWQLYQRTSR